MQNISLLSEGWIFIKILPFSKKVIRPDRLLKSLLANMIYFGFDDFLLGSTSGFTRYFGFSPLNACPRF